MKLKNAIKYCLLIVVFFLGNISYAQERHPFYIGHSLVNHNMPYMVYALAVNAGKQSHYGRQIINGSPLIFNYDNAAGAEGTPYTTAFPNGQYNTLVITEAVPLQNHLTWSDTYGYANKFFQYAKDNNNGIPVKFYIYETWHCINTGMPNSNPNFPHGCWYDNTAHSKTLWQPRLLADFPLWSGIVTDVREHHPDDEIWMVPAGQAFHRLAKLIDEDGVPGIASFRALFSDDIHLTNAGNYFVACVMYATIYGESPEGLTSSINNEWGSPYTDMPTAEQAKIMQQVAWQTVRSMSEWTGVISSKNTDEWGKEDDAFTLSPNPAQDLISIQRNGANERDKGQIFNAQGLLIHAFEIETKANIDLSDLPDGFYFVKIGTYPSIKFLKD